jgi:RNA polymerase sigma-70 factor (ECF subfamily)
MNAHQQQLQMSDQEEAEILVGRYADPLFRLCYTILRNSADAEDAVSETLMKYLTKAPAFLEEEHRKAWLIRVASNICKDMLRANRYREHLDLNEVCLFAPDPSDSGILETVLCLPEKYRTVIYLYYVEGYTSKEIADILSISPAAVRKRLQYGRKKLRLEYGKER